MLRIYKTQLLWIVAMMAMTFAVSAHNKVVLVPLGGDETPTSKTVFVTQGDGKAIWEAVSLAMSERT